MKEFVIIETYFNVLHHIKEVKEQLNWGWKIVASGQYKGDNGNYFYYTHMVKETEDAKD